MGIIGTILIIIFVLALLVLLVLYLFPIISVCGQSMYPTYHDGEVVVSTRLFRKNSVKIGDVMIFTPPSKTREEVQYVIKRVCDINKDGKYFFMGDNRNESFDSRDYGYVDSSHLVSKIIRPRERGEEQW